MSTVFLSYRSSDLENGVQLLHEDLVREFGLDQIVFDRVSFVPGTDWLPQIRSSVAAADVVVLIIGPHWCASNPRQMGTCAPDYVLEEMAIARSLRKPVLPVLLGVSAKQIDPFIPPEINWIRKLQYLILSPGGAIDPLLLAIENTVGLKPGRGVNAPRRSANALVEVLQSAVFRISKALLRPVSAASESLRPTRRNLWIGMVEGLLAIFLLLVCGVLLNGALSTYFVSKILGLFFFVAVFAFIGFAVIRLISRVEAFSLATASLALHFSAIVFFVVAVWMLVFWIFFPGPVHQLIVTRGSDHLPIVQQLTLAYSKVSPAIQISLLAHNFAAFLHASYLIFGGVRAAAVSAGSRRWISLLLFVLGFVQALNFSVLWVDESKGLRRGNLPYKLKLSWVQDKITVQGEIKTPILFELTGEANKHDGVIVVDVERFVAENRDKPPTTLTAILCALGIFRDGDFEWTRPVLEGRVFLNSIIASGDRRVFSNLQIRIPLNQTTVAGATVLQCFVETPGANYPIGDGRWAVLHW